MVVQCQALTLLLLLVVPVHRVGEFQVQSPAQLHPSRLSLTALLHLCLHHPQGVGVVLGMLLSQFWCHQTIVWQYLLAHMPRLLLSSPHPLSSRERHAGKSVMKENKAAQRG